MMEEGGGLEKLDRLSVSGDNSVEVADKANGVLDAFFKRTEEEKERASKKITTELEEKGANMPFSVEE